MLFAVIFEARPERVSVREAALPAHLEWLEKHRNVGLVGGSLREGLNQNALGGLWIVEAADKFAIVALIKSDPFWLQELRKSYRILHWSKAFADRAVPI